MSDKTNFNRQEKTYLWQHEDFPHFYNNPVAIAPLKKEFITAFKSWLKPSPYEIRISMIYFPKKLSLTQR